MGMGVGGGGGTSTSKEIKRFPLKVSRNENGANISVYKLFPLKACPFS